MFKFDFWFKISSSFFFYPFYLAILSYQFLKLLFIEFSGVGIYCSVIKVLFVVVFQFSATTSLLYHIVSCLSTTFLFFRLFLLSFAVFRSAKTSLPCFAFLVNTFLFIFFIQFKHFRFSPPAASEFCCRRRHLYSDRPISPLQYTYYIPAFEAAVPY